MRGFVRYLIHHIQLKKGLKERKRGQGLVVRMDDARLTVLARVSGHIFKQIIKKKKEMGKRKVLKL